MKMENSDNESALFDLIFGQLHRAAGFQASIWS